MAQSAKVSEAARLERQALDEQYTQLALMQQELAAPTERLQHAQMEWADDRNLEEQRTGELAEREQRLESAQRDLDAQLEELSRKISELDSQEALDLLDWEQSVPTGEISSEQHAEWEESQRELAAEREALNLERQDLEIAQDQLDEQMKTL
jgi:hypothetical protein